VTPPSLPAALAEGPAGGPAVARWSASCGGLFQSPPCLRVLSDAYGFAVRAYPATDPGGKPCVTARAGALFYRLYA